ncbi:uncharacterized protein LOC141651364 [Silene latifolia]|uniref:uncharacterized protein LOC141651364 n=1 Tax=Silene latifolia TaxID=37657 RepID=UPI003D76F636
MVVQKHDSFKYHPLYNKIKLSHLCFDDDLILICKGDRATIELLLKSFDYFSKASGLVMKKGKSNLYCNGIDDQLVREIEMASRINYWARIFILPKTVIGRIEAICRAYLWHVTDQKESLALVSWEQVCQPRKQEGLSLKYLHLWNIAAIGKYVWWVAKKKDHLWLIRYCSHRIGYADCRLYRATVVSCVENGDCSVIGMPYVPFMAD